MQNLPVEGSNNLYLYDVHIHTSEVSFCGNVDAKTVVHMYKKAGYDGLVITDHYTGDYFEALRVGSWKDKINEFLRGYRIALQEGQKLGINVLLGIELRFDENWNDYLIYGIDENFLYENRYLYKMNIKTFRDHVQDTPVLIYQAHPFRVGIFPENPEYLDGIEVYNGNPRHDSRNEKAAEYAKHYNLKMLSGSDFHQTEDLARGGIVLSEAPKDSIGFARLLAGGHVNRLITSD
jgi:predicted metal-dependent phosphoesterase TrpH